MEWYWLVAIGLWFGFGIGVVTHIWLEDRAPPPLGFSLFAILAGPLMLWFVLT